MEHIVYENLIKIWDYMHMNMEPEKADCIVGFGNFNTEEDVDKALAAIQKISEA